MWEQRQKEVLLDGHNALQRTSESLMRAEQAALESEAVGNIVVSELAQQGETLQRASDRLNDIGAEVSRSQRILRMMSKNIFLNKFILILIIIMEAGILSALVYIKFIRH